MKRAEFKNSWITIAIVFAVIVFGLMGYTQALKAETESSSSFSDEQKGAIEDLVYDYLMKNPGIVVEALTKFQADQIREEKKTADRNIEKYKDFIHDVNAPAIGNPDGDIVIVEFFDYNCGYCKKAFPDITALVKEDKNVRVILRDMPVLGPSSRLISKWALASHRQGKYWEYHVALMNHNGSKTVAVLEELAGSVGLDVEQLRKDVADPAWEAALERNQEVARDLGIRGTPGFIINNEISRGYIGPDAMKGIIATIRSDG
jgi:protein-disulfide isomerase